jgi:hypothetical protein
MKQDKFRLAIWDAESQQYKYLQDKLSDSGEMLFSDDRYNSAPLDKDRARRLGVEIGVNFIIEPFYETIVREGIN